MQVTRNFDLLAQCKAKYNKKIALAGKNGGTWTYYSTEEYIDIVNNVSYGLISLGYGKDDKIAIISPNRPEWNFVDFGVSQIGAVTVPMYPTITAEDYKFILNDAEVKLVFIEGQSLLEKLIQIKDQVPTLQHIYTFDKVEGFKQWKELHDLGKENQNAEKLQTMKDAVNPEDLMTLIYTSGTTGQPKGVMLSHNNVISNVKAVENIFPKSEEYKALSFLPLCHIFERTVCYIYHNIGVSIYYAESMDTIAENLKEVKPDFFSTVPRLLEKVYDKIVAKGLELEGFKKKLFFWALDLGLKYKLNRENGPWYHFKLAIADKLIFSKWREALGGNVKFIISGAAALQPRLATVFTAAKIPVLEGYGLTETSPVIAVNRVEEENRMFGTVGPVIENVEVKIADDGEILCKGPNVMMGYYKRPDLTAEVITEENGERWFHTGDIGTFVNNKFLKITDRKKEVFKTSGGKYIAPQVMENKFKESPYIEQLMVIGENEKHPSALIVPAFEVLKEYANKNGISYSSHEDLVKNPKVIDLYQSEVDKYNANFGNWEQIKKFVLIPNEWTIDGGEMTPTLKLKRKPILAKYAKEVESIYKA